MTCGIWRCFTKLLMTNIRTLLRHSAHHQSFAVHPRLRQTCNLIWPSTSLKLLADARVSSATNYKIAKKKYLLPFPATNPLKFGAHVLLGLSPKPTHGNFNVVVMIERHSKLTQVTLVPTIATRSIWNISFDIISFHIAYWLTKSLSVKHNFLGNFCERLYASVGDPLTNEWSDGAIQHDPCYKTPVLLCAATTGLKYVGTTSDVRLHYSSPQIHKHHTIVLHSLVSHQVLLCWTARSVYLIKHTPMSHPVNYKCDFWTASMPFLLRLIWNFMLLSDATSRTFKIAFTNYHSFK